MHVEYLTGSSSNTQPGLNITAPANGTTITAGSSLTFTASSIDTEDGNISSNIAWSSSINNSLGSGASVTATLSPGTHTITASITDSGGLSNSRQITVTVNPLQTNTAPTVNITGPANGTSVPAGTALTFSATATDTQDGTLSSRVVWSSSLDGALGQGASVTATLSKGRHTITARVTDNGGLSASVQIGIRITRAR